MKWIKINTVKQVSENGRFEIRKVFDRCFFITDKEEIIDCSNSFETLKEAKQYIDNNL